MSQAAGTSVEALTLPSGAAFALRLFHPVIDEFGARIVAPVDPQNELGGAR